MNHCTKRDNRAQDYAKKHDIIIGGVVVGKRVRRLTKRTRHVRARQNGRDR